MRPLHRFWRHRTVIELENLPAVVDVRFGPQRLDQCHRFTEASHAAFPRCPKLLVMMVATEPDPQNGAAIADVVEAGPLVRDVKRVVNGQYDDRRAETHPS